MPQFIKCLCTRNYYTPLKAAKNTSIVVISYVPHPRWYIFFLFRQYSQDSKTYVKTALEKWLFMIEVIICPLNWRLVRLYKVWQGDPASFINTAQLGIQVRFLITAWFLIKTVSLDAWCHFEYYKTESICMEPTMIGWKLH